MWRMPAQYHPIEHLGSAGCCLQEVKNLMPDSTLSSYTALLSCSGPADWDRTMPAANHVAFLSTAGLSDGHAASPAAVCDNVQCMAGKSVTGADSTLPAASAAPTTLAPAAARGHHRARGTAPLVILLVVAKKRICTPLCHSVSHTPCVPSRHTVSAVSSC
jgi:hypothetical protein